MLGGVRAACGGRLLCQMIKLAGQRLDLRALLALHALEVFLQLPQLLLQLCYAVSRLGQQRLAPAKGEEREKDGQSRQRGSGPRPDKILPPGPGMNFKGCTKPN